MNRILVPIDFSATCSNSLLYANQLTRLLKTQLTLIHVYPRQSFNRPYDFGKKEYGLGIRELLIKFYKKHVESEIEQVRFLALPGSAVNEIIRMSSVTDLVILNNEPYDYKVRHWIGNRMAHIASNSHCPVLIISPEAKFQPWKRVWHIQSENNESRIIENYFERLNLNPLTILSKSFKQTKFQSSLWEKIVRYSSKPEESLHKEILIHKTDEQIDLFVMLSREKGRFWKFIDSDAIQIVFEFNIPLLILQD